MDNSHSPFVHSNKSPVRTFKATAVILYGAEPFEAPSAEVNNSGVENLDFPSEFRCRYFATIDSIIQFRWRSKILRIYKVLDHKYSKRSCIAYKTT